MDSKVSSYYEARGYEELSNIEHRAALDIYHEAVARRKTGIVCTIGPATQAEYKLIALRKAGMNIMRMNFSHGSHEYHAQTIANLRQSFITQPGRPVAIALDTKGPEIRTGNMENGQDVMLETGKKVVVTTNEEFREKCSESVIFVDYANITKVIEEGKMIYIDDGLIQLRVISIQDDSLECIVENSGELSSHKGVNLPEVPVDLPALSAKDKGDLKFGIEQGVDMIFASFIRSAEDVLSIREVLGEEGKDIQIISKIENHQGVRNFDEILAVTDGVMVARGDLGIEIPAEKVFLAQKSMIARCNIAGKPVIVATQMLESMTKNPRPTRAEVSDVANAVMEGADCVMLSGETAKGKFPTEAVTIMSSICREAEAALVYSKMFNELRDATKLRTKRLSTTETLAMSAVAASLGDRSIRAIICLSTSGRSARFLAKYRPRCPIIVVTRFVKTAARLHLYRGTMPVVYPEALPSDVDWQDDVDARFNYGMMIARDRDIVAPGDNVLLIQGWKGGKGHTNTMRLIEVAEERPELAVAPPPPLERRASAGFFAVPPGWDPTTRRDFSPTAEVDF